MVVWLYTWATSILRGENASATYNKTVRYQTEPPTFVFREIWDNAMVPVQRVARYLEMRWQELRSLPSMFKQRKRTKEPYVPLPRIETQKKKEVWYTSAHLNGRSTKRGYQVKYLGNGASWTSCTLSPNARVSKQMGRHETVLFKTVSSHPIDPNSQMRTIPYFLFSWHE
jgi:hypothetical protein